MRYATNFGKNFSLIDEIDYLGQDVLYENKFFKKSLKKIYLIIINLKQCNKTPKV